MKIKVSVSQKELKVMCFTPQDLQECVYSDLISSDIDNEYPDIVVEIEVNDED